jgi:hypothetical protein
LQEIVRARRRLPGTSQAISNNNANIQPENRLMNTLFIRKSVEKFVNKNKRRDIMEKVISVND